MISLGTIVDGRPLYYDAALYEFRVSRNIVGYDEVVALDRAGHVQWAAAEQRDWLYRINPADLDRCNRAALGRHGNGYEGLSPEEQVQCDARRDDSVLAGKIVDADPALVRAVADALEQQGLLGTSGAPGAGGVPGTTPVVVLPEGMEALAQVQKQEGRKMTVLEHYLMRRILKNDDRQKARREKEEEAVQEAAAKQDADEAAGATLQDGRTAAVPAPEAASGRRGGARVSEGDGGAASRKRRWWGKRADDAAPTAGATAAGGAGRGRDASTVPGMAEARRRARKDAAPDGQPR